MAIDTALAKKGRREPLAGITQQARVSADIATANAAALDPAWSAEDTASLLANLAALTTDASVHADAYEGSVLLTQNEAAARSAAKAFKRQLRNALPRALRENPTPGVSMESFEADGRLGDSTPKISAYLATIREPLLKIDDAMARYFKGTKPTTILDTVKKNLDDADTAQESTLEQLPADTQKVYELKGRVLQQIEDLNRAGKNAFDGDAENMAKFNKDILLRARKAAAAAKKKAKEEEKTETE